MIRWQRNVVGVVLVAALVMGLTPPAAAQSGYLKKADRVLNERAGKSGSSRIILVSKPGWDPSADVQKLNGRMGRALRLVGAHTIELPNGRIQALADHPAVVSLHLDRPAGPALSTTTASIGARSVQSSLGLTGAGVGIAVVDSGITGWHDDLSQSVLKVGVGRFAVSIPDGQRLSAFVDFVNARTTPYDDNGHGTHVAGVIAGNGFDSKGHHTGIAPKAHLVGLKVLDDRGRGVISNVIAALEWVLANRAAYNIRVVNLSVGAAVTESYRTDPLTLAAKRLVDAGIVVVTAAGNLGMNANGQLQYGGITAPANAPWVLTVGAYSHQGTVSRSDDLMARYSSRGPTAIDFAAKPDLVAPGTGTVSLSDPASLLYYTKPGQLLDGTIVTSYKPYLSLSGTSMAAPVVAGTVALMLEANPALTPNLVKAILQYTAQASSGDDHLSQGAGFVNALGAVELSRFYRNARGGDTFKVPGTWSRQVIWGNRRISGGVMHPSANAFQLGTLWGSTRSVSSFNIVWGTRLDGDNIVWGTYDNIVWGTRLDGDNIVWGTRFDGDNIVWGTMGAVDNIVWGTDCGGGDCDNIVWGTACYDGSDNIVWGTAEGLDNIVWGTSGVIDNIVWGTLGDFDNIVWGTFEDGGY